MLAPYPRPSQTYLRLRAAWRSDSGLYAQAIAGGLAIVMVMLVAWFIPWEVQPPSEELRPGLGTEFYQGTIFLPEPGEQRAFQAALICTPLLILAVTLALRRWRLRAQSARDMAIAGFVFTICGLIAGLAGCFFGADTMSLFFIRVPVLWCGFVIVAALAAKAWNVADPVRRRWSTELVTLLLAALLGYLATHELFRGGFDHIADLHNEPIVYPITQVCAGKTLLVDARSLYGLYPHFLEPIFRVIGLDVESFGQVMAVLMALSTCCVLLVLRATTTRVWTLLLGGLAFFFFPHYALNHPYTYPYWQYYPLRTLFPALCLALGAWYCLRPTRFRLAALLAATGLAPWWNLDTGMFAVISTSAMLWHQRLAAIPKDAPRPWREAFLVAAAPLVSAVGCGLLLFVALACRSGAWPDFNQAIMYQKVFYRDGFAMSPMPVLGLWWIPVGVYIVAGSLVMRDLMQRRRDWRLPVVTQCTALGLGLLAYYQGRSFYTNLCLCSWPIVVLLTIFTDRLWNSIEPAMRKRVGSIGSARLLMLHRLGWFCFCTFVLTQLAGTAITTNSLLLWPLEVHYPADPELSYAEPWRQRIAFVRQHVDSEASQRGLLVFSSQDHAWHMALGTRSPTSNAGFNHMFFNRDLEEYFQLLQSSASEYVIWDDTWLLTEFKQYKVGFLSAAERERLLDALDAHYVVVDKLTIGQAATVEDIVLYRRRRDATALALQTQ